MQQAQGHVEDARQRIGGASGSGTAFGQLLLGDLHIPVSKVRPHELIDLASRLAILEVLEQALHVTDELLEAGPDPGVGQGVFCHHSLPLSLRERG